MARAASTRDQEQLRHLSTIGIRSVLGDASDPEVLRKTNIAEARGLIAVTGSDDLILSVCQTAREEFNVPAIIARADDPATIARLTRLDVKVVQPAMAVALALEGALHFPQALVVGVHREGEVLMPHGDTVLRLRDTLVLVGDPEALRAARRQLNPA